MQGIKVSNDLFKLKGPVNRQAIIKRVTRSLLRFALKRNGTKLIIILGRLRSGKSSLFESLTNSVGHSGDGIHSVTKEYQLGKAMIDGKVYLFVDTPGLDDPHISNADILREIAKLLYETKTAVEYVGVLYVQEIGATFSEETKKDLLFLEAFCGLDYAPSITFVTTKWDELNPKAVANKDELIRQLIEIEWSRFRQKGANLYYHGRGYENGEPTLDLLDIESHAVSRRETARQRIEQFYPSNKVYSPPLVVRELGTNLALEDTTAGRLLNLKSTQLVMVDNSERTGTNHDEQASQTGGFDWLDALCSTLLMPLEAVNSFVRALLQLIDTMRSSLLSALGMTPISVSIARLTPQAIEALIVLPGGIAFIVGYGISGPYWRPCNRQGRDSPDLDADDISDIDFEEPMDMEEETWNTQPDQADPVYVAVAEAFRRARDMQEDEVTENSPNTAETPNDGFWSWCSVM